MTGVLNYEIESLMRLGIFGGSFDPIHFGHLILAEQCREQASLDKVFFVPTAISPLKDTVFAKDKHRLEMLSLAIAGHREFEISETEVDRGGKSYTIDTLNQFKQQFPDASLFLMMGEDSLASFSQWREPKQICQLSTPLIVKRPGARDESGSNDVDLSILKPYVDEEKYRQAMNTAINSRMIDISSTDIRNRVASDSSIRYLVPRGVEKFIETNKLYAPA